MIRRVSRIHYFWVALLVLVGLTAPLPYVLVEPGSPNNVLGKVKGKPLLEITGAKVYPTNGKLNLTSIWVTNADSHIQTFELLRAWIDGERSVEPREVFYPNGVDPKKVIDDSVLEMKSSQLSAQLATLNYLKIPFGQRFVIKNFTNDSPNKKVLKKEDEVVTFGGIKIDSPAQLKSMIRNSKTETVTLGVIRNGKNLLIPVTVGSKKVGSTTSESARSKSNFLGVLISDEYDLPFKVKVNLKNVGGPSAGLMLTLGIIDELTVDDLTGGKIISGTGTINYLGEVGPIGGIRQKLEGAKKGGSEIFLAPIDNCAEVGSSYYKNIPVVAIKNLNDAISAIKTFNKTGTAEGLNLCS